MDLLTTLTHLLTVSVLLLVDPLRFWALSARSGASLRAENLFLRKQLALYKERKIKPRRASDSTRLVLVLLSRLFDWKGALLFVKPETLIGWHRKGFRLFWRWKGKQRGRPRLPMEIRALIRQMAKENITWGEERIAAELLLKLGIHVSARTVRRYMPHIPETCEKSEQWTTFIKNHAQGILACDFFVTVTANFRLLYFFVIMEIGTRRIVHINVTDHPTSGWTLQQFREAIQESGAKRFLIHDRDCIYSKDLDAGIGSMGLTILKTPVRAPTANAYCERLIRTIRRECLDFMIPLNERHLRRILLEWVAHYNKGRPHSSLEPGIPVTYAALPAVEESRHVLPRDQRVVTKSVLGGLHHEYRLERIAA